MPTNQYFSKEGLEKLKQELDQRIKELRPEIAQRIKEAKEMGDLSENAEFSEAKEAQSMNEGRIEELQELLENAVVIGDAASGGKGTVGIGSTITVESSDGKRTFTIVGASESDPANGFISNESPLGAAFLDHKKGDTVEVQTPRGSVTYTIREVR